MTTRMKPEMPLIPTMPPMPTPEAERAAQRQAMIQLIMQRYPGISQLEATQMLEAMERAREQAAREQFQQDMAQFAPPAPPQPPTYGADGRLVSGKETEPGLRPMPMGAAQPIQPPSQGTPYGQQPRMPAPQAPAVPQPAQPPSTPPQQMHGGDTERRPFGQPPMGQYGQYMGMAPEARGLANWVDTDGDGIDDRYQAGPGQPRQPRPMGPGSAPGGTRIVPGQR